MSTRSLIAQPTADGLMARPCHFDGYATGVGQALWNIVKRDTLRTARRVLLESNSRWSTITGELVPASWEFGHARVFDDRFPQTSIGRPYVCGYGEGGWDPSCATPLAFGVKHRGDTEWGYVLADDGLVVHHWGFGDRDRPAVSIPWDADDSVATKVFELLMDGAEHRALELLRTLAEYTAAAAELATVEG